MNDFRARCFLLVIVIGVLSLVPARAQESKSSGSDAPNSSPADTAGKISSPSEVLTLQQKISAVHYRALTKHPAGSPEIAKDVEAGLRKLIADQPNELLLWQEMLQLAEDAVARDDKKRILTDVVNANISDAKTMARSRAILKSITAVGQPLQMEFTAVDGRKVDLQQMKGKVVLIDFWAAWCVPCIAELPRIIQLYNENHDKGFEIVGISLDQERSAMDEVVRKSKMPWPQYHDGKYWNTKYAAEYNVGSIPAMWLVDKKGILRTISARENLESLLKELMAEKL